MEKRNPKWYHWAALVVCGIWTCTIGLMDIIDGPVPSSPPNVIDDLMVRGLGAGLLLFGLGLFFRRNFAFIGSVFFLALSVLHIIVTFDPEEYSDLGLSATTMIGINLAALLIFFGIPIALLTWLQRCVQGMARGKQSRVIGMIENQPRKRTRRILVVAAILLALIPVLYLWLTPSAEEQLRALDTERAIPDEENAANQYARVFELLDEDLGLPGTLNDANEHKLRTMPWRSANYPDIARWLDEKQSVIIELLAVCKMEKCVFPLMEGNNALPLISDSTSFQPYLKAFRQWAFLLSYAFYNDLGDGRKADAIDKMQTIMRMGNHLRQQPSTLCLLEGMALDSMSIRILSQYTVTGEVSNADLDRLTLDFSAIEVEYMRLYQEALLVDPLIQRHDSSQSPPMERLRSWWLNFRFYRSDDLERRLDILVLRYVSGLRGSNVLIALRRHKNRTGQWPTDLDQIASALSAETLQDPFSNKPFVYRQFTDSFVLYCLGSNGVDEKGRFSADHMEKADEPDDWPIWPRWHSPAHEEWQRASRP